MMRKKCLLLCMVALCLSLIATSCSKNDSVSQGEITENFKALVMGGKDIDPNHTWSTVSNKSITVSVNLDADVAYNVYFFTINPSVNADAQFIGMTTLINGETKTVSMSVPDNANMLYATCYLDNGQAICLPVNGSEIIFSGKINSKPGEPSPTIGNNWSVPAISMPSTSKYTTGTMVTPDNIDPELPSEAELHVLINNDYTGFIPALNSHTNLSVYVTGTWTLTFDQRFTKGNVLVVGKGGKVIIPDGFKLSNGGIDGTSAVNGTIIVMPGGEISGNGIVETTGDANSFYNGGTISAGEILLAGGTLYNAGSIGSTALKGENNALGDKGQFINYATAGFSQTSGSALSILNAGSISVSNTLSLSSTSRMDDGSSIECGSISLQGDGSSNSILYMGNSAYLNCSGAIAINNYGVWGPSGDNYHNNAIFKANGCSQCTTTTGNANTFMLDHIQLLLPTSFQGADLIGAWINGGGDGVSSDRKTCFFGMEDPTSPHSSCIFYCFEFPGSNTIRDFDYNDLILRVDTPHDNGDGTFTSPVDVVAIGSDMSIKVFYNDEEFGTEAHVAMGIATKSFINTSSYTRQPRRLGELTFSNNNIDLGRLPFSVKVESSDGITSNTYTQKGNSEAPLFLAINGDKEGKWFWPREGTNIGLAYLQFSIWANDQHSATNWYDSSNTSASQIIRW